MAYIKHFKNLNAYFGEVLNNEKPGLDKRRMESHVGPKTVKRV